MYLHNLDRYLGWNWRSQTKWFRIFGLWSSKKTLNYSKGQEQSGWRSEMQI